MPALEVRALLFDVFGTTVDWRSGVMREGAALGQRLGIRNLDWGLVADAWRQRYQPAMEEIRSGRRPFVPLACGMRTAHPTRRLFEYGPERPRNAANEATHDLVALDFGDLASQLGS